MTGRQPAQLGSLVEQDKVLQAFLVDPYPLLAANHKTSEIEQYEVVVAHEVSLFIIHGGRILEDRALEVLLCIYMSIRENIELYGLPSMEQYLGILADEFGAKHHPSQPNAYLLEGLPLYAPRQGSDHVSILSFNNIPLPCSLLEALISHPDSFPDEILIRWTQEQDLVMEATLDKLRQHSI